MTEMSDGSGRKLSFSYHSFKKVKRIDGPNRQFANYEYDGIKDLKQARTFDGAVYKYKYDDLHNLTLVTIPDNTTLKLTYDKNKDWVTAFTDRTGCTEKYDWILSKEDPKNNYASTLTKTCEGRVIIKNRYEFWFKQRPDGDGKYLARTLIKNGNDEVDTTYHPQFGRPVSIKRQGVVINYEYFQNGLVSTRTQGKDVSKFKYDDTTKKVIEVKNGNRVTGFKYDTNGNLISAQSSDGLAVSLAYDGKGRIINISDQAKRVVKIQYEDRFGKPKLVERPGVGMIEFSYKNDGKVKEVKSLQGGPTVAVQVASTFNSLLELVAPAGVDLGI
jgi:YD repeat-containing protein